MRRIKKMIGPRIMTFVVVALAASGCIRSNEPLFDPATAVTPLAAGRYETQELRDGDWAKTEQIVMTLSGKKYTLSFDASQTDTQDVLFFSAGNDRYIVEVQPNKNEKHYYAVATVQGGAVSQLSVDCSAILQMRMPPEYRPDEVRGESFLECFYNSRAKLVGALTYFADHTKPDRRYVLQTR